MRIETIGGAIVAALILFISSIVTLFTQDPELTFGDISQATWVAVVGGGSIAFLKDYQSLSMRRMISKVTGNNTENSNE